MKGWLAVEEDGIPVVNVSLNDVASLQMPVLRLQKAEILPQSIWTDDVSSAWVRVRPVLDQGR